MLELLKMLCSANAPSGREDEVIKVITDRLDGINVQYSVYPSGNVIAALPCGNENSPRVMVQCHTDETGFMVKGHRDGGYLSISPLGISDAKDLVGKRVSVLADTLRHGSIGAVPIHLSKDKDIPSMDDLYADVGILSKDEAEKDIPLGSFGCFDTDLELFGKDGSFISGKALSSRIPCAVLLETIKRLKDTELDANVYFAFTVRGKLSLNGATEAYNRILPDAVVSVAGIPANDTPDNTSPICRLGFGAALSRSEVRYRFDESLTAQLRSVAEAEEICVQTSRPMTEEEDPNFDIFRMKNAGAGISAIRVPVRNMNSSCEAAANADVLSVICLLYSFLKVIDV